MKRKWTTLPLGEVLTERREIPSIDAVLNGEIPIISKIGFNNGQIELRVTANTRTGMILVRPGDLVLSGINAAKGAIAIYDEKNIIPIAATIHYAAYIPNKNKVDVRYLWWFLRSNKFREILKHHLPGGIKTELKAKRLLPIAIPLPPLSKQKRIVAWIKELAAKIEEARKYRQQMLYERDALKNSLISKALEYLPCDGKLGDVVKEKPRNGWSVRCDNSDSGIPVLSLASVTGFKYQEKEFKTTSEPTSANAHYWLREGDILITRSNTPELVGHAAMYNGNPSPCIYPDLMMKIELKASKIAPEFLIYWLQCRFIRDYIQANAKGTSPTMKKIKQDTVMNIPFPALVDLDEQRRIVAYLDDLQAKVDALKSLQEQTATELDALLPSILDKAFKGEL